MVIDSFSAGRGEISTQYYSRRAHSADTTEDCSLPANNGSVAGLRCRIVLIFLSQDGMGRCFSTI